jgi:hypothetical protein
MPSRCCEKVNENCGSRRKYQVANPPKKSGEQSRPQPPKTADGCHHEKKEQIRRPVGNYRSQSQAYC